MLLLGWGQESTREEAKAAKQPKGILGNQAFLLFSQGQLRASCEGEKKPSQKENFPSQKI